MNAWAAFGLGLFCGGLVFDQLWRWLYRASGKLIVEQREYIAELEKLIGLSA